MIEHTTLWAVVLVIIQVCAAAVPLITRSARRSATTPEGAMLQGALGSALAIMPVTLALTALAKTTGHEPIGEAAMSYALLAAAATGGYTTVAVMIASLKAVDIQAQSDGMETRQASSTPEDDR